jgi:hypothetical protein
VKDKRWWRGYGEKDSIGKWRRKVSRDLEISSIERESIKSSPKKSHFHCPCPKEIRGIFNSSVPAH